jgi:hypothetical protein
VQFLITVVENPQGAGGGVAETHVAGSRGVIPTLLHASLHTPETVILALEQKERQAGVKSREYPHGADTGAGGVQLAAGFGCIRSRVQYVGQVVLNSTPNCSQYSKQGMVRVELSYPHGGTDEEDMFRLTR